MEIVITEEDQTITYYPYITPTGLARKLDLNAKVIDDCIREHRIPFRTVMTPSSTKERRIHPQDALQLVGALTTDKPGIWPDLEKRTVDERGNVTIQVKPDERPYRQRVVERGRTYTRRNITFQT